MLAAAAARAAELEEVTVTAQKIEQNLQTVPIAVTALSAEQLQNRGITDFQGVAASTPSITFSPYSNSRTTFFMYMRGIGFLSPGQIASDGAIGLYQDGFYIARPQAVTFDLGDLERVEILRGPQGTLYGRNTTGGAVNLISAKPTGDFGLKQTLTAGSRDAFRSATIIDLPQWHEVSTKISLLKSSQDGWTRNTGSTHDYGELKQLAGRLQLRWQAADRVLVDYFGEQGELDSTPQYRQNLAFNGLQLYPGIPYVADGRASRTYRPLDLPLSTARFEMHGLTATWDVTDDFTIKSLTGYRKLKDDAFQNYGESLGTTDHRTEDLMRQHQFSQEFQFIGNIDDQLRYVAGLYWFGESAALHNTTTRLLTAGGAITGSYASTRHDSADSNSKAAYGQITWTPAILQDRLDLTFGMRYTEDDKDATRTSWDIYSGYSEIDAASHLSYRRFNPAFIAEYRWTEDLSTYAKASTGYKSGSSNPTAPVGHFDMNFGPEKVTSYEIGLKSDWLDHSVRLNIALFDTLYEDKQATVQVSPTLFSYDAFNIGKETIKGAEVELTVTPIQNLVFGINYAYLDDNIDRLDAPAGTIFDPAVNPYSPYRVGDDISGLFGPGSGFAPKNSIDVNIDYQFWQFSGGNLAAHIDYQWKDERPWYDGGGPDVPGHQFAVSPAYAIYNANLTATFTLPRGHEAKLSVWGKNIFDEDKPLIRKGNGSYIPLRANAVIGHTGYGEVPFYIEPRSFGVTLTYTY